MQEYLNMSMSLVVIFTLIITHWFGDFIFQSNKQAQNKSTNNWALLSHTVTYAITFLLPVCILFGIFNPEETTKWYVTQSMLFVLITFFFHTWTDFFTSRINKKLWASGNVHGFFISMDFDQMLHYFQLFLTFYYLSK